MNSRQHQKSPSKNSVAADETTEDEFAALKIAVEKAAKDMKGKKFVLDRDGTVSANYHL